MRLGMVRSYFKSGKTVVGLWKGKNFGEKLSKKMKSNKNYISPPKPKITKQRVSVRVHS